MTSGKMPLFPQPCCGQSSLHMPLFDGKSCNCECWTPALNCEDCQCVRIQNPACPGEFADVELCVDCNGNLSICVRRSNPPRGRRLGCGCDPCGQKILSCEPCVRPKACCEPCGRRCGLYPGLWAR